MPGVQIDLKRIDDLIQRKGVWLDWYRTKPCPCLNEEGQYDYKCPICLGMGWAREAPQRIRCLFPSYKASKASLEAGLVTQGSREVTPPRYVRLTEGDWLKNHQFRVRSSNVITYGAPEGIDDRVESLFPSSVIKVSARRPGPDGKLMLVELPAACYTDPDTGVTIHEDGTLAWQPSVDGGPTPGERLTVEYYEFETYQIYRGDLPMQRAAEDKRLPDHALARRITRRRLLEAAYHVGSN